MNDFVLSLNKEVHARLDELDKRETRILKKAREGVALLEESIEKLKTFTRGYTFRDEQEEIMFFRDVKPKLASLLIFYRRVYYIELNRPKGGDNVQMEYLKGELDKLCLFFEENKYYYHYLRSGDCSMDDHYFLRGKPSLNVHTDNFYYERDASFSTNCDFKVAEILANDLIESHLVIEIGKLEGRDDDSSLQSGGGLTWTGRKIFLIELTYALHESGFINGGKISFKLLVAAFEKIFNVELDNVSRGLSDLRVRDNPTRFLDQLKKYLLRRLNNEDEDEGN